MLLSPETTPGLQSGQPPQASPQPLQHQQSLEEVVALGREQGWGTTVSHGGDAKNPGGAAGVPASKSATAQAPPQVGGGKVKSAPVGNTNAAGPSLLNTNGVCEAIVSAARYGNLEATDVSLHESADTAAAGADERRLLLPYTSSPASKDVLQKQDHNSPMIVSLNRSENQHAASDRAVALFSADAMVTVRANHDISSTSVDMQALVLKARLAYTEAEARLLSDGLALRNDWMATRDLFFAAGALFASVGEASTAARCLLHATFINRAFHSHDEALTTLAMAVEQLKRSHPRIAVDSLLRLAPIYKRGDLQYQAARCHREAAEILENVLNEKEAAIEEYRAAIDMYAETQSSAVTTAREWQRQQERRRTALLCGDSISSAPFPSSPHPSEVIGHGGSATASNKTDSPLAGSEDRVSSHKCTATSIPGYSKPLQSNECGKEKGTIAFHAEGPPQYRVNTSVQRTLTNACRWRVAILLARLGRFKEVQEVILAYAADVPGDLPKAKYLLYTVLCILAQGIPAEKDDSERSVSESSAPPRSARPSDAASVLLMIPEVDTVYFDSLYDGNKCFQELQGEDRSFQRGKENALLRAILDANRQCSLAAFDEAVRTYKGYTTTEPCIVFDILVRECRRSLFKHIQLFS